MQEVALPSKVSTTLKSNIFENAKSNASIIKHNARKNRRIASEKSAEKLMLHVSAHSVSTTSMKPDRKSNRARIFRWPNIRAAKANAFKKKPQCWV